MPDFSVTCECGATKVVAASDAGSSLNCRCGRTVHVPRLSELRRAKGLDGGESNVRDTIARMIREGSLPWGVCFAATAMPTSDVMHFDVQCERSYRKGGGLHKLGIARLVLSVFACLPVAIFLWLFARDLLRTPVEEVGRDTVITVPLHVSNTSQDEVRRWSQNRLKKLLCSVPIYEHLMTDNPDA